MESQDIARIGIAELAERIDKQDAIVLDLRSTSHGEMIYGSTRYDPSRLLKADKLTIPLPKGSGTIVLVDEDGAGKRLSELAEKFAADGYGALYVLDGGFDAWKKAGGKMQERSMEQPVPGQTSDQATR